MGEVLKFEPVEIGESVRLDIDELLEGLKGRGFRTICILIERAKHQIVFGTIEHE